MRLAILAILVSCAAAVQCDDYSLLDDLSALDLTQVINRLFGTRVDSLHSEAGSGVSDGEHALRARDYDWDQCVVDVGTIADGLNRTEMWAIQVVDAWGKIPSGILQGNLFGLGSFSECLNVRRNDKKYKSQYCLTALTAKLDQLLPPKNVETRAVMPAPDSKDLTFTLGACFPQSCSPKAMEKLISQAIPKDYKDKFVVTISESTCQTQERPSNLRLIDWITIGLLVTVFCLMIASTFYDIYCTVNELPKRQLFMVFSVYTNGRSLLSCKKSTSKDVMHCVHGIRVISTQWVVLGHTYVLYMTMPTANTFQFMGHFVKQYHSMYLLSAFLSVDTFFFLSGLFVSYVLLKQLEKTRGRINVPILYFHRFLRLTPLLGVGILLTVSLLKYAGSGPLWPTAYAFVSDQCHDNWWKTMLYVQNYVSPEATCFVHSWYLAVDTQLFVISPLFVYLIYRFRAKFLYALSTTVWLCVGCTIATFTKLDFKAFGFDLNFTKTYFPTHLRFSPWVIGLIFGKILLESRKQHVKISKSINVAAWLVALALMGVSVLANYPFWQRDGHATPLEYALYTSLSRIAWPLALSYVIYACVHGYGGPVNWFLSLSIWLPLSRLSYSVYILHFPVVFVVMASANVPYFVSEFNAYHMFLGNYVLTIAVAIIGSLAFESPIVIIEKILFGGGSKVERPAAAVTTKSYAQKDCA